MSKKTINDVYVQLAAMEEANVRRADGILATIKRFFSVHQRSVDAQLAVMKQHDGDTKKGFDANLALTKEHDKRSEARKNEIVREVRKNSANRKKSIGLLILVLIIGAALAYGLYWYVIQSGLCHLGGLWREVVQRDSWGNIIPNSFTYELVEGAKVIWGALSVAMGGAVAALLHAIIPWYRREEV